MLSPERLAVDVHDNINSVDGAGKLDSNLERDRTACLTICLQLRRNRREENVVTSIQERTLLELTKPSAIPLTRSDHAVVNRLHQDLSDGVGHQLIASIS